MYIFLYINIIKIFIKSSCIALITNGIMFQIKLSHNNVKIMH